MSFLFVCFSKIRYAAIVAPISSASPPQRLILGATDLASLGVLVAGELWWCAAEKALVDGVLVLVLT